MSSLSEKFTELTKIDMSEIEDKIDYLNYKKEKAYIEYRYNLNSIDMMMSIFNTTYSNKIKDENIRTFYISRAKASLNDMDARKKSDIYWLDVKYRYVLSKRNFSDERDAEAEEIEKEYDERIEKIENLIAEYQSFSQVAKDDNMFVNSIKRFQAILIDLESMKNRAIYSVYN